MNSSNNSPLILGVSYLLNATVWMGNFSMWFKLILALIAGATTIMAFFNQYKTFSTNFKTTWIVVTINHVVTFILPKRLRLKKRRSNIPKRKI